MPESIPVNLNCPTCGAPLEVDGKSAIVRCRFCRNTCVVPGLQPAGTTPAVTLDEVLRLVEAGDRLEAIRKYRQMTGAGLKEAQEAVRALQAGRLAELSEATTVSRDPDEFSRVLRDVQALLKSGKKLEAIKRYRVSYDVSLARAKYAVERIEAGETVWTDGDYPAPAVLPKAAARTIMGCSGALIAGVLVFVLGIVGFALAQPGGPFVPRLVASSPAILLPAGTGAAPDIALPFLNVEADSRVVGLLDGQSGKLLWKSTDLPADGFVQALVSDGQLVYVASGSTLLAFRSADGSQVWQTTMSDRVFSDQGCMLVLGGQVIVLTLDRQLQAFDALSGQLTWDRSLEGYDYQIRSVNDQLLILDSPPDTSDEQLYLLDPISGAVIRTIAPVCRIDEYSTETLRTDSGLLIDPQELKIYLVYGSFNGCIQRFDLSSGLLDWQIISEDGFNLSPDGFQVLFGESSLFFSDYQRLLRVAQDGSSLQVLLENEDYSLVPLAEMDGVLIIRAERTIGTRRFALWGISPTSGERLWTLDLSPAGPLDPPGEMIALLDEDEPGWTWHIGSEGFQLVFFHANPNRIEVKALDLQRGTLSGNRQVNLRQVSGEFYAIPEIIGWRGQVLYVGVEANVFAIDISSGDLVFVSK